MVDLAIDRIDPRADQGASGAVDRPGGGDLRQVLDLLRDALVQRPLPAADLGVRQAGEQVVDPGRDQGMGIEDFGRVLGRDGDRLDQRRGGAVLRGAQRQVPADRGEQQRRHDRADQQRPQRTDRTKRRPDPRTFLCRGCRGVNAAFGVCRRPATPGSCVRNDL